MRLKNIAVKSDNTEIDIERSACKDYLDLYATELIYCLEQIADKYRDFLTFKGNQLYAQSETTGGKICSFYICD